MNVRGGARGAGELAVGDQIGDRVSQLHLLLIRDGRHQRLHLEQQFVALAHALTVAPVQRRRRRRWKVMMFFGLWPLRLLRLHCRRHGWTNRCDTIRHDASPGSIWDRSQWGGGSKAGGLPRLSLSSYEDSRQTKEQMDRKYQRGYREKEEFSPFPFPLSFQTNQWEGRSDPVRGSSPPSPPLQIPPCASLCYNCDATAIRPDRRATSVQRPQVARRPNCIVASRR